jgi:hypothetical protein
VGSQSQQGEAVMKRRSVWKNLANGKTVRRHTIPPDQQWTWWTMEMMRSPAYRALSVSAHRVIGRIRIELADHGGQDNGHLPVTHRDFHEYGMAWNSIAPGIREAEALGFIHITEHGIASAGEFRKTTMFALTHLPVGEAAATNDWAKISSMEEVEIIATAARKEPAQHCRLTRRSRSAKNVFPLQKVERSHSRK